jgi:PmbA protein
LQQADSILSEVSSLDKRAVVTGGGLGVSATAGVLTSSEGIEHHGITTSHGLGVQVSIEENDQLTSSWQGTSSKKAIDEIPKCIANSVEWAQKTRDPIKVDNGAEDLPVLMTSEGLGSLFSNVIPSAIRGERLSRMESFWSGKQGHKVLADDLTLIDNARMEGGISSSSRDGEGVPTQRQVIVESGKLVGSLWSTRDSAKLVAEGKIDKASTTGSASRGGHQSPPVTTCSNLQLISSSKSNTMDELLERMGSGYVVNSVMGAHTANPTSGDFSVTTSSILRVEDGEVIGAIKQAGLSGNMAKALSEDVFLGNDVRVSGGSMHIPDILLMQALRVNPI